MPRHIKLYVILYTVFLFAVFHISSSIAWKQDTIRVDNYPGVTVTPYLYQIAEGNIIGHSAWSKIGYNPSVGTIEEDMWPYGGNYTFPSSAIQMEAVSDSIEDDLLKADGSGGGGIRTMTLYYLDASGYEHTEDINLNGTAAVTTTATDIYRVQNMRAKVCGSFDRSHGNISIRALADTPVYGYISEGQTRMRQCVWTVPTGKTLYVTSVTVSAGGTTKPCLFTTRATYDDKAATTRNFTFPYHEMLVTDGVITRELEIPTRLPAGTDLKVSVIANQAATLASCALRGWVETE